MQLDVMCCLDLITSRSWRVGAKLVRDDLGVSITGERRPPRDLERPQARDLVQSSADDSVNCDQYEQQQLQQQQQKMAIKTLCMFVFVCVCMHLTSG